MDGRVVGGTWEGLGGNGAKWGAGVVLCATDGLARGGQACASRPSARCPFHLKSGLNLGRGWVESGRKTDKSLFVPACWAV
jgi:hypothetical protein